MPARAPRLSLRAFAKLVGVTDRAVRKAIASGRLTSRSIGRDARGPFVRDVAQGEREWRAGVAQPPNDGGAGPAPRRRAKGAQVSLVEAQRRVAVERAAGLRLANRKRRGELLEARLVERQQFEAARVVREAILNVPTRLAAELAAEADERRVHARLTDELRSALATLADVLAHG